MSQIHNRINTPYSGSLNYSVVPLYAKYLKERDVRGVLINGTNGEGMSLSVDERKRLTEAWVAAARSENITLMVQIGGAPYPDVVDLAKHAEKLGIESVLCLPELYFKPKTEEELVGYLASIAQHCPSVAMLYYHIPRFTNVMLDMPRFCSLAREKIPNFVGIKYTSGDLERVVPLVNSDLAVFVGASTLLCGTFALGFDSAITPALNLFPELPQAILKSVTEGNLVGARRYQMELNQRIEEITKRGDLRLVMKEDFNNLPKDFKVGQNRVRFN